MRYNAPVQPRYNAAERIIEYVSADIPAGMTLDEWRALSPVVRRILRWTSC